MTDINTGIQYLTSTYKVGVDTIGTTLKNANRQLRSEPPNPQKSVSPWMNTSISADIYRKPLEIDENCQL